MSNSIVPVVATRETVSRSDSCAGCRCAGNDAPQTVNNIFVFIDAKEKKRTAQRITFTMPFMRGGNWFEHFLLRVIGFIIVAFFITFFTFYFCNWHINKSPSFPRGIYKMDTGYRPAIGDLVFFKPLHTKIFRDAENNGYYCVRVIMSGGIVASR